MLCNICGGQKTAKIHPYILSIGDGSNFQPIVIVLSSAETTTLTAEERVLANCSLQELALGPNSDMLLVREGKLLLSIYISNSTQSIL